MTVVRSLRPRKITPAQAAYLLQWHVGYSYGVAARVAHDVTGWRLTTVGPSAYPALQADNVPVFPIGREPVAPLPARPRFAR